MTMQPPHPPSINTSQMLFLLTLETHPSRLHPLMIAQWFSMQPSTTLPEPATCRFPPWNARSVSPFGPTDSI